MILEYLGPEIGVPPHTTFDAYKDDNERMTRLSRGLSRVMLSLARIPQPRIGSFWFNNDGTIALLNRPASANMVISENAGAARTMERNETFSCTDAYISDLLHFHDQQFLSQRNAAHSEADCHTQMATKTLLRFFAQRFVQRQHRYGPFVLQSTDLHRSNIFVDDQWNVTALIDLEWVCALPAEAMHVPYWLTGLSLDELEDEDYSHFDKVRQHFLGMVREEETACGLDQRHGGALSQIMQRTWDSKAVWFWHSLHSVDAMYHLVEYHLCPGENLPQRDEVLVARFWSNDADEVVKKKLADNEAYKDLVRALFQDS